MLINPSLPVYLRIPSIPLGLVSIASYLEHYGHDVVIVERSVEKNDIKSKMQDFRPDIVGISSISYSSSTDAIRITKFIHKNYRNLPVVCGGAAASALPELYLREAEMDFVILGEGEVTWKEFVDAWKGERTFYDIKGLAFLDQGKYVCNPMRPVADLRLFPELDWSLVDPQKYYSSFFHCTKMLYLHASKGCPAACTFCANKQFHQGRNRCRDPRHIMHDIEYLVGNCGADGIYFSDEIFLPQRSVRNELLDLIIKSERNFVWGCQMRLGVLKPEDIDLMYAAGCRWILFGIESGCEQVVRNIKKGIDLSLAKPTIDYCFEKGITVQASFIIGFPGETEEQIKQTVNMAKQFSKCLPVLNILTVLPNSEIYNDQIEMNPDFIAPSSIKEWIRIEKTMTDKTPVNLSCVPYNDLKTIHYYFQWKDFSNKSSVAGDSYGIVKKLARDTFDRVFKHGLAGFFYGGFNSVKQFLTVFYYSHFFPSILRKYDLTS